MTLSDLKKALGYDERSPLYREDDGADLVAPEDRHIVRKAREAGVKGTFFFRTSPEAGAYRPAVHLAEVSTPEEARAIHRRLWNQGVNPFLIVLLPAEVRVYTGFEYHPDNSATGLVKSIPFLGSDVPDLATLLSEFNATAINRGEIWHQQRRHLRPATRVDATLLKNLKDLSELLQNRHGVGTHSSHSLIGRFVYLHYLRARGILSDPWLRQEAEIEPDEVFSPNAALSAFRRLSKKVEATFNGRIFPIAWGGKKPPRAAAVTEVARMFSGEVVSSGQMAMPFSAYDFSFIPIELLSSIYEQFLHAEGPEASESDGAHYTPEPLAEYVASEVQSVRPLRPGMRVLDGCCGSGIFLVVAFRRLVEFECASRGVTSLPAQELKSLLMRSIYGVERNGIACEIAAFSLILAMLTYIDPPELHRFKKSFKFPSLKGKNLFTEDFFLAEGRFWKLRDSETQEPMLFDWIIGNPPWTELKPDDEKAGPLRTWMKSRKEELGLARDRPGEAFAWKVTEKLKPDGVAGLVLAAKTLTNDQLKPWRAKFFAGNRVHRVTNFANLAYVIFPKVKEPAMTITFSGPDFSKTASVIQHFGPFVANQIAISQTRKAWIVGLTEAEIKTVPVTEAVRGDGSTWKLALWGTHRDPRELARLKSIFPVTLGSLALERGWNLALGLQLRNGPGKKWKDKNGEWKQENEYVEDLGGLPVLDHKALVRGGARLQFEDSFMVPNDRGCYVRGGRKKGVGLIRGPHVFLWNDFAAYSEDDFIVEHDKVCVSAKRSDRAWLRAVSLIWTSSITQYFLILELSAAWGIGRSQIDLGDAENVRLPFLDEQKVARLSDLHRELASEIEHGRILNHAFRRELDRHVARELKLPSSLMSTATDFAIERMAMNQGVVPPSATRAPEAEMLRTYARRLAAELDFFVGGKAHHRIKVIHGAAGICATIEVTHERNAIPPLIQTATGADAETLNRLLTAAEHNFTQWVYVKRSVRILDKKRGTLHLIKPARQMEWTEARAILDAGDVIAEVASQLK